MSHFKHLKLLTVLLLIFVNVGVLQADVKVADIFNNHMVLQRNMKLKVWGTADAREKLILTFNGKNYKTKADKDGKWEVTLQPMAAGGPYEMTIEGNNKVVLKDILIGDVWLCSGQSNMQWRVDKSNNAKTEIANANYKNIRLFTVPRKVSEVPKNTLGNSSWEICSSETIKEFSAVGYFFGRTIHLEENVPIGLISSNYGGTCVETWTSKESITQLPKFVKYKEIIENFDVEREKEKKEEILREKIGEFPKKELGIPNKWMLPETDKSNWKSITLPSLWEKEGYEDLDGLVWFSKDVEINSIDSKDKIQLHLGIIDDSDIVWVNGVKVGEINWGFTKKRVYNVPNNILKNGKNNIIIRVQDRKQNGGFKSKPKDFFIKVGQQKIALGGEWKFKVDKVYENFDVMPNELPSLLYNAMIHPLIPYGLKGVIWYQGENNTPRAKEYAITFPNLINNWRKDWGQGDFPFLFVQLANFTKPVDRPRNSNWAELRESQTKTLSLNNTGMALAIDLGEANDIHPRNKQDVGTRLALAAQKVAYGKDIVHSGPKYKSVEFKGDKAIISFDNIGSGLKVKGDNLKEFTIAGSDKRFYRASAKIKDNKIVVWSSKVKEPIAVRFAWAHNPSEFNLYNKEGLPAIPFRTDNWKLITEGKSFDD